MEKNEKANLDAVNVELEQDANEIADAITGYMQEMGNYQTRGFALFIVDYNTGHVSYVSDIDHNDAVAMLGVWVNNQKQ